MPINKALYHPRWDLISRWIRFHRAKGRCEGCGVKNYSAGHWMGDNWFTRAEFDTYKEAAEYRTIYNQFQVTNDTPRVKVIILTTAHLDHDPRNNHFSNLKAFCQRCHFNHDRQDNARRMKYGKNIWQQMTLFDFAETEYNSVSIADI
jgi:glyoxylase-like metal-dependent hydrolase (beta-lactamase superfamily II)